MSASLALVQSQEEPCGGLAASLGLECSDPPWLPRVVTTSEQRQWLLHRWDRTRTFTWQPHDNLIKPCRPGGDSPGRSACLDGLPDDLVLLVLIQILADNTAGVMASPPAVRGLRDALRDGGCKDVADLPDAELLDYQSRVLRRWQMRPFADDPAREWQRDQIRLQVILPDTGKNRVLYVGRVSQPWLRALLVKVLQHCYATKKPPTLISWVRGTAHLSRFLATRDDGGNNPRALTGKTMTAYASNLRNDPGITARQHDAALWSLSPILTKGRALGIANDLPDSFSVQSEHYCVEAETVWQEKAFSDALFAMLLGGAATFADEEALAGLTEQGFGQRVLDLAASIPGDPFSGQVFVNLLHTAANFGRRTTEACSLPANRIVEHETTKQPGLIYDNFKSGRDRVWLPIDRHSRGQLQAWTQTLRQRYPETPLDRLALFPATNKNEEGLKPLPATSVAILFRRYVLLLEQAIILGLLSEHIGIAVAELTALTLGDMGEQRLTAHGKGQGLDAWHWQMLVDYRADLVNRWEGRARFTCFERVEDWPLFPDPFASAAGMSKYERGKHGGKAQSVAPARFDPLGTDWPKVAATYRSAGLPSTHFGEGRINPDQVKFGRFRHTYLQQLVNIGTDIFIVQELADHGSVQTTLNSYVQVQDEKLRESVEKLQQHRTTFGQGSGPTSVTLTSRTLSVDAGADCANPQVHNLGVAGCDRDRHCFDCDDYAIFDPSHLTRINQEIATITRTLLRIDAEGDNERKVAHVEVLNWRRDGWRRARQAILDHLDSLDPVERELVLGAAKTVEDFRSRVHNDAGITLGST